MLLLYLITNKHVRKERVPSARLKLCISTEGVIRIYYGDDSAGISKYRLVVSGSLESVISVFFEPAMGMLKVYVMRFITGSQSVANG
jgi:hypothetical protein